METISRDATNDWYNSTASPAEADFLTQQGIGAGHDTLLTNLSNLDANRRTRRDQLEKDYGLTAATDFDSQTSAMMRSIQQRMTIHSFQQTKKAEED